MGRYRGNTTTEYAIVLGLVGVLGIMALGGLGGSLGKMLGNTSSNLAKLPGLDAGLTTNRAGDAETLNSGSVELIGPGHSLVGVDPETGEPRIIVSTGNGSNANATSVEGNEWNMIGGMKLAEALESLASEQSDPAAAAWIQEMAKLAYYQAGAEGVLEGQVISPFDPVLVDSFMKGQQYGEAHAVSDLKTYQAQLKQLMENPPAGISRDVQLKASALASDAYNISKGYVDSHSPNLDPHMAPGGAPFDRLLNLETLKADAQNALHNSNISSKPVETALGDAVKLDNM